jgi:hypothetical protein
VSEEKYNSSFISLFENQFLLFKKESLQINPISKSWVEESNKTT